MQYVHLFKALIFGIYQYLCIPKQESFPNTVQGYFTLTSNICNLKSVLRKNLIVDRYIIDMYILKDFKTKQKMETLQVSHS